MEWSGVSRARRPGARKELVANISHGRTDLCVGEAYSRKEWRYAIIARSVAPFNNIFSNELQVTRLNVEQYLPNLRLVYTYLRTLLNAALLLAQNVMRVVFGACTTSRLEQPPTIDHPADHAIRNLCASVDVEAVNADDHVVPLANVRSVLR